MTTETITTPETITVCLTWAEAYASGGDVKVRALLEERGLDTRRVFTAAPTKDGGLAYTGSKLSEVERDPKEG